MKNPLDFFGKKTQAEDTYLGLFLKENEGILFYISQGAQGNLRVSKKEKFTYSDNWERLTEDVDQVLNRLETATGKSPEKTVFFIYSNLVDPLTRQIKRNYLHRIKLLVKNLELKPLGFIECHEAISDDLQQKEKMPLTATLIEFDKAALGVFIYTTGRLIFAESVPRTESLINDLLPVFEKIRTETVIPPRIILYDSKDLEPEASTLLTYQWGKDFFIQLPRVQIFKEEQVIESFLKIFSTQMAEGGQQLVAEQEKKEETKQEEVMGFVIGDDVKQKPEKPPVQQELPMSAPRLRQPGSISNLIPTATINRVISRSRKLLGDIFKKTKGLPFPVLPAIGIVLILGALFVMEYFFHSAKVRVFLPAQELSESLEVAAQVGVANNQTLALQEATEAASLTQSQPATGATSVGEKAKGAVTVLNYDSSPTSFDAGTVIQAQGLKFVLDNNVSVASASVAPDLSLQPGKANVAVTAEAIGPESNLTKDQKFQVADSPQNKYLATNPNAFAGGSKKDIQVVSEEDIAVIEEKLLVKAKDYVKNNIGSKLPKDNVLISQLITYDLGEIEYSQGVGDEATSVEGESNAEITYTAYRRGDLLKLVNQSLAKKVQSGFRIDDKVTKAEIKEIDGEEGEYTFNFEIKAKAVEDIKTEELMAKTVGKSSDALQRLAKDEFHAEGIDIEVHHPISFLKNWLPFFSKNIQLEVSYL